MKNERRRGFHWIAAGLAVLSFGATCIAADDSERMQRLVPIVSAQFDPATESGVGGAGVVFAVTPEHLFVVTAAHVVRERGRSASVVNLLFADAKSPVRARVGQFDDKDLDIAVLIVDQPDKAGLKLDNLPLDRLAAVGSVHRGDPVFMIGRRGSRLSVNVTPDRISTVNDTTIAVETNFIVPGFSGGPLLNERWQLLGMMVRDNAPEGEASPMPAILAKLKQWNLPVDLRAPHVQVAAGSHVSCRIDSAGAARCWGAVDFNEDALSDDRLAIPAVRWASMGIGHRNLCGVDVAGAAWCLGENPTGQLGNNTTSDSLTSAVRIAGGLTFTATSVGGHSCGIALDGTGWCWGQGDNGQLGNDGNTNSPVPVQVAGGIAFKAISAGLLHTCAVATDGQAWCWGSNELAEFSEDKHLVVFAPAVMPANARFQSIGAGYTHTCALGTDGAAYCWGQNDLGQLGDGTHRDHRSPSRALGEERYTTLRTAVTGSHNCGLTGDGSAWCWGFNGYGQLGNGTQTDSAKPVAVSGGLKFVSISTGRFHTCGVTADDAIWCWGGYGGLGIDRKKSSSVPARIGD